RGARVLEAAHRVRRARAGARARDGSQRGPPRGAGGLRRAAAQPGRLSPGYSRQGRIRGSQPSWLRSRVRRGGGAGRRGRRRGRGARQPAPPGRPAGPRPPAAPPVNLTSPDIEAMTAGFPEELRPLLRQAISRLVEYQDRGYAGWYLERVKPFVGG